jgi:RNA polymerase sigma factor (sigma-70 family)
VRICCAEEKELMTQAANSPKYDAELFERARAGDETAINDLVIATQVDIRRYAKLSCAAANVDDAVQETLWLLSKRIGTINMLASLPAWLFTVVKRECYRVAQKAHLLTGSEDIDAFTDDLQLSHRPENELRLDLIRAVQSLPEHYRYVVLLRDINGMTIEEIADELNRSRESIKAQLHRARLLIREYLI